MIVRILEDGQYEVDDDLGPLQRLDEELEHAVKAEDQAAFEQTLRAMISEVRSRGRRLEPGEIVTSDLALPAEGSTIDELQSLLNEGA